MANLFGNCRAGVSLHEGIHESRLRKTRKISIAEKRYFQEALENESFFRQWALLTTQMYVFLPETPRNRAFLTSFGGITESPEADFPSSGLFFWKLGFGRSKLFRAEW